VVICNFNHQCFFWSHAQARFQVFVRDCEHIMRPIQKSYPWYCVIINIVVLQIMSIATKKLIIWIFEPNGLNRSPKLQRINKHLYHLHHLGFKTLKDTLLNTYLNSRYTTWKIIGKKPNAVKINVFECLSPHNGLMQYLYVHSIISDTIKKIKIKINGYLYPEVELGIFTPGENVKIMPYHRPIIK
jgi:hypothetical protein